MPIAKKLDEVVSVTNWMPTPYDENGDHTDWLNDVVEKVHAAFAGGVAWVTMPHPLYQISDTWRNPYDNIFFVGGGGGYKRNSAANTRASAATRIMMKAGSTPVPLVEIAPTSGAAWYSIGGGLRYIMLDGNNVATRCLSLLSCRNLMLDGVHGYAATEAQLYGGAISGFLGQTTYASTGHLFLNCIFHNHNFSSPAYGAHMTGGQAEGGTHGGDNFTICTFRNCAFSSTTVHGVRMENADGHDFYGGSMASEMGNAALGVDGLVTGFGGLELCSSSQSGGFGAGVARTNRFFGVQINDAIVRAAQAAGGKSPYDTEFICNNYANAGGTILVERAVAGADQPHVIAYDAHNGIRVWGNNPALPANTVQQFQLIGVDRVHYIDGVGQPAATPGYVKEWIDSSDGSMRVRFGDGTIRVNAPKANIMAQAVGAWPNGAGTQAATLLNSPVAGPPTKWIPVQDVVGGVAKTYYIPAWQVPLGQAP